DFPTVNPVQPDGGGTDDAFVAKITSLSVLPQTGPLLGIAGNGVTAGQYDGRGVWRYKDGSGLKQLSTKDAYQVGVDASGNVVAEFLGQGVYRYSDATSWVQL